MRRILPLAGNVLGAMLGDVAARSATRRSSDLSWRSAARQLCHQQAWTRSLAGRPGRHTRSGGSGAALATLDDGPFAHQLPGQALEARDGAPRDVAQAAVHDGLAAAGREPALARPAR